MLGYAYICGKGLAENDCSGSPFMSDFYLREPHSPRLRIGQKRVKSFKYKAFTCDFFLYTASDNQRFI